MKDRKTINRAIEIIKTGGLVAFPTETVYGLGADMFNENAIQKIFIIKNRPLIDPLIVHIGEKSFLDKIAITENDFLKKLMDEFWPGPLTLILPKKEIVSELITSGLKTVAVRMPKNKIALEIINKSSGGIVAPSANPFGYLSPTKALHVKEQLGDKVDLIIDGGTCDIGIESTVLDLTKDIPTILRPGLIDQKLIENIIGEVVTLNRKEKKPNAPGQFPMHYSPLTPLILIKEGVNIKNKENSAFLGFKKNRNGYKISKVLSSKGNLEEAANNLFCILHILDKEKIEAIYVEEIPDIGIGKAIKDRLYKASQK